MSKIKTLFKKVNEKNINNFKQNKIKYLVKDFAGYGVTEEVTREILLKRGINKWLANRSRIIELKDDLKIGVKYCLDSMRFADKLRGKQSGGYRQLVGMLFMINEIRQEIRKICHSSRWQFPE